MHLFITGEIGAGKSTIVNSILQKVHCPVYGFTTKRGSITPLGSDVFMYPASGGEGRAIAVCRSHKEFSADLDALNEFGMSLLAGIPDGALVLMDELGFLEGKATAFCKQVLKTLDRNVTVLGAIKPLPDPFLDSVRAHPHVRLVKVTPQTRNAARSLAEGLFFGQAGAAQNSFGSAIK